MLELRHLRYFVAVAEELHFGRAAKRLHMAQSPLSQQIRALERQLGVELIDRPHSVVGLTDAGKVLLAEAYEVLGRVAAAEEATRRAARGEEGTLRVGYVGEVTTDLLPLALKASRSRLARVALELEEGSTGELLDAVRAGALDVVFVRAPWHVGDLHFEALTEEALMLASPADALAPGRQPSLDAMTGTAWVLPTRDAARGLRADIDAAHAAAGLRPATVRNAGSVTAVLLLVAAGAGCALVPASVVHLYPVPGVDYHHLAPPAPTTRTGVAWRRGERSEVLRVFLDVVRATARDHLATPDVWPERHLAPGPTSAPGAPPA